MISQAQTQTKTGIGNQHWHQQLTHFQLGVITICIISGKKYNSKKQQNIGTNRLNSVHNLIPSTHPYIKHTLSVFMSD